MTDAPKRRYVRIPSNFIVKIRNRKLTDSTRIELEKIKNISAGGVFIETKMPFPMGSVIEMEFTIPQQDKLVSAKGVVKWSNDGSIPDAPIGMGVEFYSISHVDVNTISEFVKKEVSKNISEKLSGDPKRKAILKLYSKHVGGEIPIPEFLKETGILKEDTEIVQDFVEIGILSIIDDKTVKFTAPEDRKVLDAIVEALKEK